MWDDLSSNLLSSKYDPLENGKGEIGLSSDEESNEKSPPKTNKRKNSTSSVKKRKKPTREYDEDDELRGAISAIVNMNGDTSNKTNTRPAGHTKIEDMSMKELFEQMEYHKAHLKFLTENDRCFPDEKMTIVNVIKDIYNIITRRSKPSNSVS